MTDNKNKKTSNKISTNNFNKNSPKISLKNLNHDTQDIADIQSRTIEVINHNLIPDNLEQHLNSANNSRIHTFNNDNHSNLKQKEKKMNNRNLLDSNKLFDTEKMENSNNNSIQSDDLKKLKKKSSVKKTKSFSIKKEKQNDSYNIILPLINQNEKNNDKSKKKTYSLKKKNTILYSQNPLELSFGDSQPPDSINNNENIPAQNTRRRSLMVVQRNNYKNKLWYLSNEFSNKSHEIDIDNNAFYNTQQSLNQAVQMTKLKKHSNKNTYAYKKLHTVYDNTKDTNHKFVVKFENNENDNQLSLKNLDVQFPNYPTVKHSEKEINKHVKCFAVNTYKGLMKNSNEDKVSIILTICKPKNYNDYWPKCSFLALFDGKYGKNCCNFLRDELHNYITRNNFFPKDPKNAILTGFKNAEKDFMEKINENSDYKNGSCALIAMIIDDMLYIANCGDSHAILSMNNGKNIKELNNIHNLNNLLEKQRIIENGGKIINSKSGKLRILPGKLSISRGFGFANAKIEKLGGKEGVIIETPEITEMKINDNEFDFLILATGGVFEKMSVDDSIKSIYNVIYNQKILGINSIHQLGGMSVDMLLKTAIIKGSLDNVTCILIGFKNFKLGNEKKISENVLTVENNTQRQNKSHKGMNNIKKKNVSDEENSLSNDDDKEDNKSDEEKKVKNGIKDDKNEIVKFRRRSQITRFTIRDILKNVAGGD